MNFFKNSLNKLLGKTQDPTSNNALQSNNPNNNSPDIEIPQDALRQLFEYTSQFITVSKAPAPDNLKLQLYGFFKQATTGDCNAPKPAIYQFVAKSKWQAWNNLKGMSSSNAMKNYIATAVKVDPAISARMAQAFNGEEVKAEPVTTMMMEENKEFSGLKMVEQKDFSDEYSHPYFKAIEKGQNIEDINKEKLMQKNNSPAVYPLHFAIDKEREDLVPKFLELLSVEEVEGMKDEEGTGILEYAELIENEPILEMIKGKLNK